MCTDSKYVVAFAFEALLGRFSGFFERTGGQSDVRQGITWRKGGSELFEMNVGHLVRTIMSRNRTGPNVLVTVTRASGIKSQKYGNWRWLDLQMHDWNRCAESFVCVQLFYLQKCSDFKKYSGHNTERQTELWKSSWFISITPHDRQLFSSWPAIFLFCYYSPKTGLVASVINVCTVQLLCRSFKSKRTDVVLWEHVPFSQCVQV